MSLATLLLVVVVYIEVRRVQGRSMSTNLLLVVSDLTDPCNLTEAAACLHTALTVDAPLDQLASWLARSSGSRDDARTQAASSFRMLPSNG